MFDLHIIVNSISIAIERRKFLGPFRSLNDFAEFHPTAKSQAKEKTERKILPCDDAYAIVNVKVNLFINMIIFNHSHGIGIESSKEKKRKSLNFANAVSINVKNEHNVITIIVASSWKLSCNLMSIVLLRLLLLTERTLFYDICEQFSLSRRLLRKTK